MKRGVTSLILFVAAMIVPAAAQMRMMGGGRVIGGARPSFGMVRRGGMVIAPGVATRTGTVGMHARGGLIVSAFPFSASFGFRHRHNPFFPHVCFRNPFFCNQFFRHGFFRPGFNPFLGSAFFGGTPWWGWPVVADYSDSSDSSGQAFQAAMVQQQQMIAQLEDEIRHERQLREAGQSAQYAPQPSASAPPATPATAAERPITPTVLVFRDRHRTEVGNYAIVGNTLYDFAPHWTKKVLLSDLDLPETVRVNEDRGIEFHLPGKRGVVTHP